MTPVFHSKSGLDDETVDFEEVLRRMPAAATSDEAAEFTPAKLAPLVRGLQPRPARLDPAQVAPEHVPRPAPSRGPIY